jgi:hypothetical protein
MEALWADKVGEAGCAGWQRHEISGARPTKAAFLFLARENVGVYNAVG